MNKKLLLASLLQIISLSAVEPTNKRFEGKITDYCKEYPGFMENIQKAKRFKFNFARISHKPTLFDNSEPEKRDRETQKLLNAINDINVTSYCDGESGEFIEMNMRPVESFFYHHFSKRQSFIQKHPKKCLFVASGLAFTGGILLGTILTRNYCEAP